MTKKEARALRVAVVEYLQRVKPEGFPSPSSFSRSSVEIDQRGRIRIGSWLYDPATQTLTDHAQPGKIAGCDRVVHVVRRDRTWTVEGVSLVEVFGSGRGMP